MNVKLIAVTQPVIEDASGPLNAEDLIVYCARVSNPQNQANLDTGAKLIKYCLKNGHWSIFETASMTVEIETSMAIGEQLLRHRSFTFQKFSGRYAEMELGFEHVDARGQDSKNRQNSLDNLDEETKDWFRRVQHIVHADSQADYEQALARGIAKECARFLLPASTRTRLYMTGNVRSWIHYLEARTHRSTQKEHRDVANEILGIFRQHFPVITAALYEKWAKDFELEQEAERAKELDRRVKELEAEMGEVNDELDDRLARIKKLERELDDLQVAYQDRNHDLVRLTSELEKENEELRAMAAALEEP